MRIPVEPTKVDFCPIPVHKESSDVKMVRVGKNLHGTLVWGYQNGDALIRLESSVWYVPSGHYTVVSSAKLN